MSRVDTRNWHRLRTQSALQRARCRRADTRACGTNLSLLHGRHAEHVHGLYVQYAATVYDDGVRRRGLLPGKLGVYRQQAGRAGQTTALTRALTRGAVLAATS